MVVIGSGDYSSGIDLIVDDRDGGCRQSGGGSLQDYREEVTDLQKRVLLLKAAERKEIEEILTRSQKTLLEELQSPKKDQASESGRGSLLTFCSFDDTF